MYDQRTTSPYGMNNDDDDMVRQLAMQYFGQGQQPNASARYPDPGKTPSPPMQMQSLAAMKRQAGSMRGPQQAPQAASSAEEKALQRAALQRAMASRG